MLGNWEFPPQWRNFHTLYELCSLIDKGSKYTFNTSMKSYIITLHDIFFDYDIINS